MSNAQLEWIDYLTGIKKANELTHPANISKLSDEVALAREHQLIMLGYNQAMLEWCQFPITHDDGVVLTREHVEKTVRDLRSTLDY